MSYQRTEIQLLEAILLLAERQEITNSHILHEIRQIRRELNPTPTQIHSSFGGTMPVTLAVGQTVVQTLTETDAVGTNVPVVPANLTDTSSDTTIATVVSNNDGTFTWTAVAPGTATSSFADTAFGLSGTDTLTVTLPPDNPTAIASSFGTPQ